MTAATLTTAGATLWTELEAGGALTTTYGTLLLGRGNEVPADDDTNATVTDRADVLPAVTPVKGSTDARNPGRGAAVWTYAYEVPATADYWVASNVGLADTPLTETGDLAVHGRLTLAADPYRRLLVWVNVGEAAATVHTALVEDAVASAALRTAGSRSDLILPSSRGLTLRQGESRETCRAGESVPFRARVHLDSGSVALASEIEAVRQGIESYDGDRGQYVSVGARNVTDGICSTGNVPDQQGVRGGINFETKLGRQYTRDGADKRVTYSFRFFDGSETALVQYVRVTGR